MPGNYVDRKYKELEGITRIILLKQLLLIVSVIITNYKKMIAMMDIVPSSNKRKHKFLSLCTSDKDSLLSSVFVVLSCTSYDKFSAHRHFPADVGSLFKTDDNLSVRTIFSLSSSPLSSLSIALSLSLSDDGKFVHRPVLILLATEDGYSRFIS